MTATTISFLLVTLFGSFFNNSTVTNRVITLYVNTAQVEKPDVNLYCDFGQDPAISNEDFTINANIGDTITWQGVSSNAPLTDVVNITSINHEGGKNVFSQNYLNGDGGDPEKVVGIVLNSTPEGRVYKYKVSFTVFNDGVMRPGGTFHIDPKIQVH